MKGILSNASHVKTNSAKDGHRQLSLSLRRLLLALIIVMIVIGGTVVRIWAFKQTKTIRYVGDVNNAWVKGSSALQRGNGRFFDGIVAMYKQSERMNVDYPPIRMYIKTAWVQYIKRKHGPEKEYSDSILYPMLMVNYCFELLSVVGMYYVCRLFRGCRLSLLAAVGLWFNPAVIYNTMCWPQWDVWIVPPLIWATWALLRRGSRYRNIINDILVGLCLGVGAMLKGQILFGVIWFPLFAVGSSLLDHCPVKGSLNKRPSQRMLKLRLALLRLGLHIIGFLLAIFVITLPFTIRNSLDWFGIYRSEVVKVLPMTMSAWNLPLILVTYFNWHSAQSITAGISPLSLTLMVMQWLKLVFVVWLVLIVVLSFRVRKYVQVLLAIGTAFTVAYAILPGMHERYVIWGIALLSVSICVKHEAVMVYLIITILGFACQFNVGLLLDESFAPRLKSFLNMASIDCSWLWLACAVWLTIMLLQLPRDARVAEVKQV